MIMNASLKINSIGCVLTPGIMFFSTQLSLNGLIKIIFLISLFKLMRQ